MTGREVIKLRESLGWGGTQLATLLGVHPSTVYRWEDAGKDEIAVEPLQSSLLSILRTEANRGVRHRDSLAAKIVDAIGTGGTPLALHRLLDAHYANGGSS
jgi:transcriptional regulator with XRE-family HTH domain